MSITLNDHIADKWQNQDFKQTCLTPSLLFHAASITHIIGHSSPTRAIAKQPALTLLTFPGTSGPQFPVLEHRTGVPKVKGAAFPSKPHLNLEGEQLFKVPLQYPHINRLIRDLPCSSRIPGVCAFDLEAQHKTRFKWGLCVC